jgi:hypothetical protein
LGHLYSWDFAGEPEEIKTEIFGWLATREQEGTGCVGGRKSKDQANRADLFFGWNRVDKTY